LIIASMLDEHHGQGGSYVLDPETGVRRPVIPSQTEPITDGTADTQATPSRKNRGNVRD